MRGLMPAWEPSIIPAAALHLAPMTFTGAIGAVCMLPLRLIISACVALGIHPNVLTLIGVLINIAAGFALAHNQFLLAGVIMIVANIFDFIDGKVAHITGKQSAFGAFWDSTLDRFSDLALFTGLIWLYSTLGRHDYVLITTLTLIFATMTSYARARAESLVQVQGRVHGAARAHRALHDRRVHRSDGGVLWVILVLSVVTVANRIYYTYLALNQLPMPSQAGPMGVFKRAFFWTDERATLAYDLWVIAILAFVWLTPPAWIGDPTGTGPGLGGFLLRAFGLHQL